jgi:SP family sugar:H+ symporter-like MFS transporter
MHMLMSVHRCYQLFITIGIFTADCINYGTEAIDDTGSYRIPMAIGYIWALVLGVGVLFLPVSYSFCVGSASPLSIPAGGIY